MTANNKHAREELAAAHTALQHCALLFTLIENQVSVGADLQNAIQLAQIGNEKAAVACERAEAAFDYFVGFKRG